MSQIVNQSNTSAFNRSPLAPTANGSTQKGVALVPTNTVNTNDGVTVRARIDPTLTVEDVVRQLCINLKIRDAPARYALRDETGELVTNDNLRKKIKAKQTLKCVVSSDLPFRPVAIKYIVQTR
jgi:engulfment/cell motility protein 1